MEWEENIILLFLYTVIIYFNYYSHRVIEYWQLLMQAQIETFDHSIRSVVFCFKNIRLFWREKSTCRRRGMTVHWCHTGSTWFIAALTVWHKRGYVMLTQTPLDKRKPKDLPADTVFSKAISKHHFRVWAHWASSRVATAHVWVMEEAVWRHRRRLQR